ncbi:MAG: glucose-1-phosphate thymidylyltransferase [Phototrophicaceae bacterium]
MLSASDFFDLDRTQHSALFTDTVYVWDAIKHINDYVQTCLDSNFPANSDTISVHPSTVIEGDVHIGEGTTIAPSVYIQGPTVIGKNCEIRQGAYIRGNVILGDNAIVGHNTELKHTVMLENAHAPHFSYLGDSILGMDTNLGAGTKLSNLPVNSTKDPVTGLRSTIHLNINGEIIDTGLAKFGAILGDSAQTGCNSVTNPGCVIGARTWVYPLMSLNKGYYPADSLIKLRQTIEIVERRYD